jgi:hypothetical protein
VRHVHPPVVHHDEPSAILPVQHSEAVLAQLAEAYVRQNPSLSMGVALSKAAAAHPELAHAARRRPDAPGGTVTTPNASDPPQTARSTRYRR